MRIFFDTVLVLSALTLPFPATLALICLGFFLYPHYVEAVVIAVFIELLYRGLGGGLWIMHFPLTLAASLLFVVVEILRSFIREQTRS